ncbi:hypothetical protein M9H77_28738 [Catharanthus roseus]|uniref:Uncharacterized protein n=1 Tax=Catharanthus roseus TaxID=4058 RepID=A0ACC0AI52_CATRO|nr:hypothetical protein M9H77_28738 [Catharanthus roseus]
MGMKKGAWTAEEDHILISFIQKYGHQNWRALPKQAGLLRCGKSCRLRWTNYLRPDIKRGNFTKEEEETIINLHQFIGNRWSAIATRLPGRTDNEIKNYWHTHLKKRVQENSAMASSKRQRFGSNNIRISETWNFSNQYLNNFKNINGYCYNANNFHTNWSGELAGEIDHDDRKSSSDGQDQICLMNKVLMESRSRAEVLSTTTGEYDFSNNDADFWYNVFVNAGN